MICCCTNVYKTCKPVHTCLESVFLLPYTGLTPGTEYVFRTDFLTTVIEITVLADTDGKVTLPTGTLNEDYEYIGGLYDVTGAKVPFTVNTVSYDCIAFTTKQLIDVS